jgi:hypothetical protein
MDHRVRLRAPRAGRFRQRLATSLSIAVMSGAALAGPVFAAPQSLTVDGTLGAGPTPIGTETYDVGAFGTLTVSATAELSQPVRETLAFDDGNIRQGRTVAVDRSVVPSAPGSLTVHWTVTGFAGSINRTATVPCTVGFSTPVTCNATSSSIRIFGQIPVPLTPFVDMELNASVTVTPGSATLDSTVLSGAVAIAGPTSQSVPSSQSVVVPCNAGVGDTLALSDSGLTHATSLAGSNGPQITIGAWITVPFPPFIIEADVASFDVGAHPTVSVAEDLVDPATHETALGAIKANNVPPDADAGGNYSGNEGQPIQFDGSATTALCGPPTLRWDFSDGGVAFGAEPFHTFTDNGIFSGILTATDSTGLTNATTFSITVGNVDPAANAGPDTTADWGRLVAFNGQATDPGAGDQATLQSSWDFGDGSPSAAGGSTVFHSYAAPGDYVATLTVTDDDGGSDTDTRTVHVTKRDTSTGYLGATAGTYDTAASLRASLVDEYGANLNARQIAFTVAGNPAGSAATNSFGIATRAYTPLLAAGIHATNAQFAGDSLYNASSDSSSITIARKATSVTYTGALNGAPNKAVGLSAILADASGTRLAGRTIVFVVGSQTKSAVTDANGVTTTTLVLTQKNAIYPLTATFTPVGADAGTYLASSDAESFKLQKK